MFMYTSTHQPTHLPTLTPTLTPSQALSLSHTPSPLALMHSLTLPVETAKKRFPFPCPTTFGTALRCYVDIAGKPSPYLLRELVPFTTDEADKAFLQKLIADHTVSLFLLTSTPISCVASTQLS